MFLCHQVSFVIINSVVHETTAYATQVRNKSKSACLKILRQIIRHKMHRHLLRILERDLCFRLLQNFGTPPWNIRNQLLQQNKTYIIRFCITADFFMSLCITVSLSYRPDISKHVTSKTFELICIRISCGTVRNAHKIKAKQSSRKRRFVGCRNALPKFYSGVILDVHALERTWLMLQDSAADLCILTPIQNILLGPFIERKCISYFYRAFAHLL